jgi:CMP-N-acetylneuraminic acid synthetase
MKILIPAREGSKGFPHKNRQLFNYTADMIPVIAREKVYVTTDDPKIVELAKDKGFNVIMRPKELANDTASMKEVVAHAFSEMKVAEDELVAILYLTYPQRRWTDLMEAVAFYLMMEPAMPVSSLLCKKEVKSNPYLCMYDFGHRGKQIINHDLYRRQDYPKCFELSHFMVLLRPKSIDNLNNNLYDSETLFWEIEDRVDVDHKKDLLMINEN